MSDLTMLQRPDPQTSTWGIDIGFDSISGMVFLTAVSDSPVDYGGGAAPGTDAQAVVVALESDGTFAWHRVFPYALPVLAVAAHDGVAVGGSFDAAHDFGGGTRTPRTNDGFVARYASDGSYRWDTVFATAGYVVPTRVHIDSAGRVLGAGQFGAGAANFGGADRPSSGPADAFVVSLDATGTLAWDYTAGGTGRDFANVVATDSLGRAFVVGAFEGVVDFGGGPESAPATRSAFLLGLTDGGEYRAVTTWGGGMENEAVALGVDSVGNPIVAGYFEGTVNFGGGARTAPTGGRAAFYAGFDPALNHRYDSLFTYPGFCPSAQCTSVAGDLAIGPADSTVITGEFYGSIDFGSGARTSAGESDGFIVRLPR